MLAERRSLKRFLAIYLLSTFFLIAVGEYMYYMSVRNNIIREEKAYMERELKAYLSKDNRPDILKLRDLRNLKGMNVDVSIYKNNVYMFGTMKPKMIYYNREFWVENNRVYFLFILPELWGKIYILTSKKLDEGAMRALRNGLVLFNLFVVIFVSAMAFVLGKIFLRPMKDVIHSLNEFIRDATHEMNTPISVILMNIEMLEMKGIKAEELKRIKLSANRLHKIFKDLSFVKFNHKQKRVIEKLDLKGLVEERLELFRTSIEKKGIRLNLKLKNTVVEADREDMIRVVDNLISNAVKYSPPSSVIEIVLDGNLKISNQGVIKDTKGVMGKFIRENKSEGGFGIGLYVVKKICDFYSFGFEILSTNSRVSTIVRFNTASA